VTLDGCMDVLEQPSLAGVAEQATVSQILMLLRAPVETDPRAARALVAAQAAGHSVETAIAPRRPRFTLGAQSSRQHNALREFRGLVRCARLLATTVRLVRAARGLRPDVVHAHDLDTLPAGWLLARRRSSRLVYDAHELYTGFDQDPPRLWLALTRRLEGSLARRADRVVTVSDEIARALVLRYGLRTRPLVVLNCPAIAEIHEVAPHDPPIRAIYQAASGPGRSLGDLPEVNGVEIHARVLGGGGVPKHVTAHDPVAPDQLINALEPFDVGLVIDAPETENVRLALPNKLFEYMMAGLAVAVPNAPAMASLVRAEGIGVVYEHGTLKSALMQLGEDRDALERMRRRARAAAVERYNAEAQRPALYEAWGV
jgi:glycogen(starch) synthase